MKHVKKKRRKKTRRCEKLAHKKCAQNDQNRAKLAKMPKF